MADGSRATAVDVQRRFLGSAEVAFAAGHLDVVPQYLADLAEAVVTVRADPELAKSGGAAAYGMMAHVPLRGMVKTKVLDLFAEMYRAGGGALTLKSQGRPSLPERMMARYANWRAGRN